ncbi:C2H2-type domain-containing protein [Caenorhabditis elegans]|uniref:C2H2-type domain-containing protein n=1 Tax=Caenorhabditis elegans TaxID=6239 RepID=Q22677_CAEEL|nr:C2H2-type domain-containing protein [Caenorhabditis elegans]CAA88876.4 C2H2-type domain-containing protein [Caenorhabditis elegans]
MNTSNSTSTSFGSDQMDIENHSPKLSGVAPKRRRIDKSSTSSEAKIQRMEDAMKKKLEKEQKEKARLKKREETLKKKSETAAAKKNKIVGAPSEDPKIRALQCDICFALFKNADKKKRHDHSHKDEPEVYCPMCNAPIKYKYNLKQHMNKCQPSQKEMEQGSMLAKAYPDYLRQLQEAAVNPSLPMPTLNGMPYRMDRYSFVTGFDMSLDVHLDVMLPKYPTDVFSEDEDALDDVNLFDEK